ncbi:RNA-binding domain-containing protein [Trichoderma citrinoviride]|uniref:RNA-binding domain-containing protein n=1 Tax=Trichoderma citrinoviride TaxID=58853 RepID=A0A2T4B5N7_9HYPO|nr:RNA-binding domain-containing protein [Trichoderma citrinoviride]PTB64634.1 RNA-binding domain-containing protein [Trichoderma citrinoviride]
MQLFRSTPSRAYARVGARGSSREMPTYCMLLLIEYSRHRDSPTSAPDNGTVAIAIPQPSPVGIALASAIRPGPYQEHPHSHDHGRGHAHTLRLAGMAVTGAAVGTGAETAAETVARPATALPDTPRFIVVERLSKNVNEDHLFEIFGQFGPIYDLDLPMNRTFGTNRGTAYILYDHHADAEAAIAHMHEAQIDGSTINVSVSTQRSKLSPEPPMSRRNANRIAELDSRPPFHGTRGRGPPSGPRGARGYGPRSDVYRPNPLSPGRSRSPRGAPPSRGGAGRRYRSRSHGSYSSRSRSRSRSPLPRRRGGGNGSQWQSESEPQPEPEPQLRQRTERFAESRTEL